MQLKLDRRLDACEVHPIAATIDRTVALVAVGTVGARPSMQQELEVPELGISLKDETRFANASARVTLTPVQVELLDTSHVQIIFVRRTVFKNNWKIIIIKEPMSDKEKFEP